MNVPVPANGVRFNGRERLEHERRGWIFQEFTFLTDSEPQFVIVGHEDPCAQPREEPAAIGDFISDL